jgi:Coiled stalk of trimeric autotransporter adhesin
MAKLVLDDVQNIYGNTTAAETALNNNFSKIEAAIEKTLSRDGTTPNTMSANLDMNSQRITNLAPGINPTDGVTVSQLQAVDTPSLELDDLTDVAYSGSTPSVGDLLIYNGTTWQNSPASTIGGVNVLNDLQDVVVTAPVDQQALVYNGAEARWENTTNPVGVTDHGVLTGLTDDDHPQYLTKARGDTYYPSINVTITGATSLAGGGTIGANRTISLVNDVAVPGASRYYGTSSTGTKGFHPLPEGITDHGGLFGLSDDDHPQYLTNARGDARYSLTGHVHTNYAQTNANATISGTWTFSAVPYFQNSGAFLYHGSNTMSSGKITVSADPPSGGANGDIWLVVV